MKNLKIKVSTWARLGALMVALINQVLAIFGQDLLPFTGSAAYQIVSISVTVIIVAINAWYNNDISKVAILSGHVLDALKDGKLTEDEVQNILDTHTDDITNIK